MKPSHHKDGQELNALLNAPHMQVKQNGTSHLMDIFLGPVFSITYFFANVLGGLGRDGFYASTLCRSLSIFLDEEFSFSS